MRKIACLFPGQGSQAIGMGAAWVERFPEVRILFEQAQDVLGWDLLQICREGPEERLRQTDVAQPALFVCGYAAFRALQSLGVHPDAVAGHSIGEYTALAAANVFSYADGLALVRERARLMRESAAAHPGGMMAILGLDAQQVQAVCQQAQERGVCVAVNFNSPEQTVIAGDGPALEEASKLATAQGAKRVVPLNVSGAFHSPLMAEAARAMRTHLGQVAFRRAVLPVVMNADGKPHQLAEEIRQQLERQLDQPVQWVRGIQSLRSLGITDCVECGPGRVLTGLLRRIDRELVGYDTETIEAVQRVGEALGASRKGTS